MSANETRGWLVSGRVQGVFFRESTRRQAEPLGLAGHAVNLSDGRVEVVACGSTSALDQLEQWLQHGPRSAIVEQVERTEPAADTVIGTSFRTG